MSTVEYAKLLPLQYSVNAFLVSFPCMTSTICSNARDSILTHRFQHVIACCLFSYPGGVTCYFFLHSVCSPDVSHHSSQGFQGRQASNEIAVKMVILGLVAPCQPSGSRDCYGSTGDTTRSSKHRPTRFSSLFRVLLCHCGVRQ